MVDIKLGEQVYEGVESVKMNTPDGGTEMFFEQSYVPWELLPESGVDALGEYTTVAQSDTSNVYVGAGYLRLKKNHSQVVFHPASYYGRSYDVTEWRSRIMELSPEGLAQKTRICPDNAPCRLILPERYPGYGNVASLSLCGIAPVALYLSKTLDRPDQRVPTASWISSVNNNATEQIVKCPKDTDIPYYLNKMTKLTVDSMVGLFENLIDRSGESAVMTITLGTENLNRLTEEQMDIARQKGWSLA